MLSFCEAFKTKLMLYFCVPCCRECSNILPRIYQRHANYYTCCDQTYSTIKLISLLKPAIEVWLMEHKQSDVSTWTGRALMHQQTLSSNAKMKTVTC